MRFIKLMISPFENASRNKRELSIVQKFEQDIIIVAKGDINNVCYKEGFLVHELSTKPIGAESHMSKVNKVISIFTWARYIRNLKADFISCHGIISLFIGWISTIFHSKDTKPQLIYDSHEFELGVDTLKPRGYIITQIIKRLEKFLIERSVLTIVVSESISSELQLIHKLKVKPLVVRNIPMYWMIDENKCSEKRIDILKQLGKSSDNEFIVMYHGAIMQGRGIETIIEAIYITDNVLLVILGYGIETYIEELKKMCVQKNICNRVAFIPAVKQEDLWQYIGAVDIGMITIPNRAQSYYFMLPNKLFENIQSLTPIICSNFPEIAHVIQTYNIGISVDPGNKFDISNAIRLMHENKKMYSTFKNNLIKAKDDLCWENESMILEQEYGNLFLNKRR